MIGSDEITLRSIEPEDIKFLTSWNYDATINQFFPPKFPNSRLEQEEWFRKQLGPDKKKLIAVDLKNEKPFALIGFMSWDQLHRHCEIGITVGDKDYWGQIHVKKAFSAALAYGFDNMNLQLIHLRVFETNERAIRFFEKFGFQKEGVLRNRIFKEGVYHGWLSMSLTQDELVTP
jgi:RimJ/RimL family protein N-acetyltransferase